MIFEWTMKNSVISFWRYDKNQVHFSELIRHGHKYLISKVKQQAPNTAKLLSITFLATQLFFCSFLSFSLSLV